MFYGKEYKNSLKNITLNINFEEYNGAKSVIHFIHLGSNWKGSWKRKTRDPRPRLGTLSIRYF